MTSLERRPRAGPPTPNFSHSPTYWLEYSRIWVRDILPILAKYKYRQIKRDQIALWSNLADDMIDGINRWLDRHGF
ncbi:hypothetical protein Caci_2221 [Catenulispora acidiphila DSM 44928]|uniref:Uncharacterized protein n=1 Tax=Catenulispora acidiphila (strain DSM 44928 / JCM 14897 / NBRC 102108 / NRRL B-24433 / ID139908) TaxID=479433 RepID=C7QHW5_CATAD|nr:hypothetical protein [Catenulispora acidiphila]ACU71140.1 hypothetical protein Caci_2221 [Catenulispora acidiphila DSM 44928]